MDADPVGRRRTLLARAARLEALVARAQALQVAALAELSSTYPLPVDGSPPEEFVEDEVCAALGWTNARAGTSVVAASRLVSVLPCTYTALADGRVDLAKAHLVAAEVADLSAAQARTVDVAIAPLLATLTTVTVRQLRTAVRGEVAAVAPAAARARQRQATTQRSVSMRPDLDGMAVLTAVGPAAQVVATCRALRTRARQIARQPGETRRHSAIQFDLLVGAVLAGTADTTGTPGGSGPVQVPATLNVTVSLETLLGLDQRPAHLAGYGPVTDDVARALSRAPGSRLRRLVTDPVTGVLVGVDGHTHPVDARGRLPGEDPPPTTSLDEQYLDLVADLGPPTPDPETETQTSHLGTAGHDPSPAMRRLVELRYGSCAVPWCSHSAAECDLDHRVAHPAGPTCPCNLQPLCRRHHRMKQRPGWAVTRSPDGTTTWTTPTGAQIHRTLPPALARPRVVPEPVDLTDHGPHDWPDLHDWLHPAVPRPRPGDDPGDHDLDHLAAIAEPAPASAAAPPDLGDPPF